VKLADGPYAAWRCKGRRSIGGIAQPLLSKVTGVIFDSSELTRSAEVVYRRKIFAFWPFDGGPNALQVMRFGEDW
jgi:hypothetical protein